MKTTPKKILVIRSSAMGDVAMTAPVLAAVARAYPGVELVMLTRGFYEPFFDGIPNLKFHNIDLAKYHRGFKGLLRLFRELRKAYPDIDLVVDLQDKIYSKLLRKFYRFSGVRTYHIDKGRAGKKALTALPAPQGKRKKVLRPLRSSVERYADAFRQAGFGIPAIPTDLAACRQVRPVPAGLGLANTKEVGKYWVGIAPFAQHKGKVYPLERMREVALMLIERWPQARIFIFGGGEEERQLAASMAADDALRRCMSVVGRFGLREEMDLMANLDLMVSMDSSAMHMASLVGIPVVSVWGATHPYAGFLGLGQSMEDAVGMDTAIMPCRPCSVYGHKECWRGDYACLDRLGPERIFERITAHLN